MEIDDFNHNDDTQIRWYELLLMQNVDGERIITKSKWDAVSQNGGSIQDSHNEDDNKSWYHYPSQQGKSRRLILDSVINNGTANPVGTFCVKHTTDSKPIVSTSF